MLHQLEPGSYFGATRHLYDSAGLTVAESDYPAQFVIPPHEHVNSFFCFVLEGQGTQSWPGRAGAERPMALTLFPRGHAHANYWVRPGKVLHVEFADPWLERLRGRTDGLERPGDFERGPPTWLARRLASECRAPDNVSHLVVEGLTLELLAECTRSRAKDPVRVLPAAGGGRCPAPGRRMYRRLVQPDPVPKGVKHRPRAPERTVILMMEGAGIAPTGDA